MGLLSLLARGTSQHTGVASAATSVVIGAVAGNTSTMRVGAGGIMLPNHAPLVIAEQFGTLESLFPGRIDLALGRAPGKRIASRGTAASWELLSHRVPGRGAKDALARVVEPVCGGMIATTGTFQQR